MRWGTPSGFTKVQGEPYCHPKPSAIFPPAGCWSSMCFSLLIPGSHLLCRAKDRWHIHVYHDVGLPSAAGESPNQPNRLAQALILAFSDSIRPWTFDERCPTLGPTHRQSQLSICPSVEGFGKNFPYAKPMKIVKPAALGLPSCMTAIYSQS